jgi:16S rRNA A1518/A1519 N6-dimethyltransferase RsmA/KsgA/DIM1 with predicted DNA glycosylase/AP lyase activity
MLKIFDKLDIKPKITAVELDPEMIKLSKKVDNLELIEGDAYDFIFNTNKK